MDEFYILKSENVKEIKDILKWANNNSLNIYIDMLNCKKGFSRIVADKTFIEVLNLIDGETVDFLRIILRKDMNVFGILSDKLDIRDILEIAVRNVYIDDNEYFIFIYLDKDKLYELFLKYELLKL